MHSQKFRLRVGIKYSRHRDWSRAHRCCGECTSAWRYCNSGLCRDL